MGMYKKSEERYEETRSSAYTFLIIGVVGLLLDLLGFAGIIPLPFTRESNLFMLSVMGVLFVACIIFGVYSMQSARKLSGQIESENEQTEEILTWFQKTFPVDALETGIEQEDSSGDRYYKRQENIKDIIQKSYGDLPEDYLESLVDQLYTNYFPEDNQ